MESKRGGELLINSLGVGGGGERRWDHGSARGAQSGGLGARGLGGAGVSRQKCTQNHPAFGKGLSGETWLGFIQLRAQRQQQRHQ